MHYMLFYDLVDNALEARTPHREEHLARAAASLEKGELVMAGALVDPVDQSIFVFKGDDASVAEDFARNDPYVINGVATAWTVRPWMVAIPKEA